MQYKEYGEQNSEVIILLHGGGLSWWNYRDAAIQLQNDYHIILPILDGHAESDKDFSTIEDNAAEIIAFIDERFDGSVLLIGGLSLGGQILLELLSQRKDICQYAMIESALVIPSKVTRTLIKPAFGSCYGLIRQKWFSKLQFQSLRLPQKLFSDYYRDTCGITRQNMIAFLQENAVYSLKASLKESTAEIHVFVGEKENKSMLLSAEKIHAGTKDSVFHVLKNMYHGEFSINYPEQYVKELKAIIAQQS